MATRWDGKRRDWHHDAALLANWPGMRYDNEQDYIGWGFWAAKHYFPRDPMKLHGKMIALMLEMIPDWHPNLRRLVELSDPTTFSAINIRTSQPLAPWTSSSVTLLGDAIHTMTPGRGAGANTALRDARLLCKQLVAVRDGQRDIVSAIQGYEEKMHTYGTEAVRSLAQMNSKALIHQPGIGRMILAGQRTMLQSCQPDATCQTEI